MPYCKSISQCRNVSQCQRAINFLVSRCRKAGFYKELLLQYNFKWHVGKRGHEFEGLLFSLDFCFTVQLRRHDRIRCQNNGVHIVVLKIQFKQPGTTASKFDNAFLKVTFCAMLHCSCSLGLNPIQSFVSVFAVWSSSRT